MAGGLPRVPASLSSRKYGFFLSNAALSPVMMMMCMCMNVLLCCVVLWEISVIKQHYDNKDDVLPQKK
jgi:hypothetical protein